VTVPFDYVRAGSLADALAAGRAPDAQYIAGGTTLVDLLRLGVETPRRVVDLSALGWGRIEASAEGLRIGALVRNSDLAYHSAVARDYPVLSEALLSGASPQLRNMATVGGNLLQRTRCSYFRDAAVAECNKRKPGSGCAALTGYHRMHAVLGASPQCIAAHPSDMCVALVALDAQVHTHGSRGERTIPIAELHRLPEDTPELENALEPGELVTAVSVPSSPRAARSVYVKTRDRASFAFALASAAVALELEGAVVKSVRVALGGVGTKPWRAGAAEQELTGKTATRHAFERAAEAALADARPLRDNAFKIVLARRTIVRALSRAAELT
jgi:xanthine dehydrogenase YagS FAD-binding subunit